jgi:hypothetical protein
LKRTLIYYHANCNDGFGAAWAFWRKYRDDAQYIPMEFGANPPHPDSVCGHDVIMLDIAFPPDDIKAIAKAANSVLLIDHHETTILAWNGNQPAITSLEIELSDGKIVLDLARSASVMAWEYLNTEPVPGILRLIQDYDLGKTFRGTAMAGTEDYVTRLSIEPKDFAHWDMLASQHRMGVSGNYRSEELEKFLHEGNLMVRQKKALAEKISTSGAVLPVVINGVRGLMVNGGQELVDEICHQLALISGTFGATWVVQGDRVRLSLRANDRCNVEELAKSLGGGGRKNTAGALIPMQQFIPTLLSPAMVLNRFGN